MRKYLLLVMTALLLLLPCSMTVYADSIGGTGDTDQGDKTGSNVYTFYYYYNSSHDAIELTVNTKNPIKGFGNTTSHTYSSPSDGTVLNTANPQLGRSLESAIADMNSVGGYNLSATDAKAALNGLGYYDKGNGVWKYSGGYLTNVSAVKIRPKVHTVTYNANGGSGAPGNQTKTEGQQMYLSSTKPTRTGYTFKYWTASIGGNYSPGANYTHDQDGGTVTMTAYWKDETNPSASSFTAVPNSWSSGNGTISLTVRDQGSGLSSIVVERYSNVTKSWTTVKSWSYSGTTSSVSKAFSETSEGVFYYRLTVKDVAGNATTKTSNWIYLDHSSPVISGTGNTVTSWTKTAPVINVSATDYLSGTRYTGSGLKSLVIKDDAGSVVASGVSSARYTLASKYQGTRTFTVTATDNVGHTSTETITTRYDITGPSCSGFSAIPNSWSAGNGTVSFTCVDAWSGMKSVVLERYSYVTGAWTTVRTWSYSGTTSAVSGTYTETSECVFYYKLTMTDQLGNTSKKSSATIYLDHSNPVLSGMNQTVTDWTNIAPVIRVSATDYFPGTSYTASGLSSVVIKDDSGRVVGSGVSSAAYTLEAKYEGIHTWYITAVDGVGHSSSSQITTQYDITKPGVDGTEITFVKPDGVTVSGYCQDNIISQHTDDEASRSVNRPNVTSGIKEVTLFKVKNNVKTIIYSDATRRSWGTSDTHSNMDVYYDINAVDEYMDYYLLVVSDFAGNTTQKKLTSQKSLLTWFHTSIDRSSYE